VIPPRHVPLAVTIRSGMIESLHSGSAVVLDPRGAVVAAWGDVSSPLLPRSAVKPLQLHAMLGAGLDLPGDLLALVTASHGGQPRHISGVQQILGRHGLSEADLDNTPDWPLTPSLRHRAIAAGEPPRPLLQNCSGKHAGMLATCTVNGWPVAGYRAPEHPVQLAIRGGIARLTGGDVTAMAVDGCGAPAPALSLTALAKAFGDLARGADGTPGHRISASIRHHPGMVGGDGRDITAFLEAVPSAIAKDGAEAVWAAALPDGQAVAVKIGDGGERAVAPVLTRLLALMGVSSPALDAFADRPVLGHGSPVGRIEPAF